jgi:hypothetical protein
MKLKSGYNYSDYFNDSYRIIEDDGEAMIDVSIDNVKTEEGRGHGYGVEIYLNDGEITSFRIRSYSIDVEIPATIEMHNKIKALQGEENV